ncbi:hypothetical protein BDN72DRAFT_912715 [Pluteus cervinus]|uniref:Uncharacterized protein n=1 Tax=Pluteus cervinus TaxID=181527 RepID=A0ACD3AQ78_9AGAR|nr:hypothetical protein BDN72DRAFT_912715 [Pluteus cervinus]
MSGSAIPEIIWFRPTRSHIENPWQHIVTTTPQVHDAATNLWYSSQGGVGEERVLIINWKTKPLQNAFMKSPSYVSWCLPLLDVTNQSSSLGQFRFPAGPQKITEVFNSPVTEFMYFPSELIVEAISQYMEAMAGAFGLVGIVWGEYAQEEWSSNKIVFPFMTKARTDSTAI